MVFSSLLFLCRFLPIVLILYYVAPVSLRNLVLFICSLVFYAWGEPVYIFIMIFSTFFDYSIGRWIGFARKKNKPKQAKLAITLSVVVNLGILCLFKYSGFAVDTVNSITGSNFNGLNLALPIGISFYTFQTMSYSIDVYRGQVDVQKNIINFGAYVAMFPQLIAGPIVRYKTVAKELNNRKENLNDFSQGVIRFTVGLGKKVLLANTAGALFTELSACTTNLTTATAWLGILAYHFQIYFDFSGYSDMAIGLGRMFGFHFLENFDYPYESKSITEFWRRWHISLGAFFREYIYIPLGGNRKGKARQLLNIAIVWLLTGLWHGANWNFVLWGAYFGIILIVEKLFLGKLLKKAPNFVGHLYALALMMISWIIFTSSDMASPSYYIQTLFGFNGNGFADSSTMYYLSNYIVIFIICTIGSTSLPKMLAQKVTSGNVKVKYILTVLFVIVILAMSFISLVSDTYNPFLYFRF